MFHKCQACFLESTEYFRESTLGTCPRNVPISAMLRLLAWTVADARGAAKIMTKADALVVGKR
eukprot:2644386-Prymnesium_polylepis.1